MVLDPVAGSALLTELGFLHVPGRPVANGRAYLFVALRATPTLRNFDPESVRYWANVNGRGVPAVLERSTRFHGSASFSWGVIDVVDRLSISNEFVAFGGDLVVRRLDDVDFCVFSSDAPIGARGGHSQGWDAAAAEMAAFMGRLRAAAGDSVRLESEMCDLAPLALYGTFIADTIARHTDRRGAVVGDPSIVQLARSERTRLQLENPMAWEEGARLAQLLR